MKQAQVKPALALDRQSAIAITSFGTLLLLACFVYGQILQLNPFGGDNVRVLFWADGASASAVLRGDPAVYPEWRPLAYLTVWLQYRWFQIAHLEAYYVVNLLLWVACAWLVCQIVRRLTHAGRPGICEANQDGVRYAESRLHARPLMST